MTIYRLRVAGVPAPKGSLKCVGRGARHQLIEDDDGGGKRRWRKTLTEAAQGLAERIGRPLGEEGQAITLAALVVVPRPKAAARRQLPTTRSAGDLDKLFRMLADALVDGGVMADDSRMVAIQAVKVYETAERPTGVVLYVTDSPNPHQRILTAVLDAAPELREINR